MSIKRRDIIRHFEKNGFFLKREGSNHSIYSNNKGVIVALGRHNTFSRFEANDLCKEAGISAIF